MTEKEKKVLITVRITMEQRKQLKIETANCGMSLQQYCFHRLLRHDRKETQK